MGLVGLMGVGMKTQEADKRLLLMTTCYLGSMLM